MDRPQKISNVTMAATTVLAAIVTILVFWGLSNETLQAYWNR